MLLAIDTTLGTSVAVVDRDLGVLAEVSEAARSSPAAVIGQLIKNALEISKIEPRTLSGVALGIGPGPRGRLDIGVSVAHGFAIALGKPVVRVLSHDAVMLDRSSPTVVVTEVGDGLSAWTAYDVPDAELGLPTRQREPAFILSDRLADSGIPAGLRLFAAEEISAGAVGMLAERLFAGGRSFARKEPYYAPNPDTVRDAS